MKVYPLEIFRYHTKGTFQDKTIEMMYARFLENAAIINLFLLDNLDLVYLSTRFNPCLREFTIENDFAQIES